MIAGLGHLLRRVTDRSERQYVTLDDEADFLRKYLDIQQMRFAERLRLQIDMPAALIKPRYRTSSCSRWLKTPSSMASPNEPRAEC